METFKKIEFIFGCFCTVSFIATGAFIATVYASHWYMRSRLRKWYIAQFTDRKVWRVYYNNSRSELLPGTTAHSVWMTSTHPCKMMIDYEKGEF